MHIKTAVQILTEGNHRLAWRTDRALDLLNQWRSAVINDNEFQQGISSLCELDPQDLASDEEVHLDLFNRTMYAIANQTK
jgi:hypothetical protein